MNRKKVHSIAIRYYPSVHWYTGGGWLLACLLFASCSLQKKISTAATEKLLALPDLQQAHTGICIYEPASRRYWYNYQADKYFTPASITKIFTCYAGMKYLGDSLTGLAWTEHNGGLLILPNADPTLLHPDYNYQPVVEFLQHTHKKIFIAGSNWQEKAWGPGWSWNDYSNDYMAERSALPVYGNTIRFVQTQTEDNLANGSSQPTIYTIPEINWKLHFNTDTSAEYFSVQRNLSENSFSITQGREKYRERNIPFITQGLASALELLKDTTGKDIRVINPPVIPTTPFHLIHTQPSDSVFSAMMRKSDNLFAEQTLLMVSNRLLGIMNDEKIIDTLLKTDFKDLPQPAAWADGSGLSRYNLFTPQDIVWALDKMQQQFSWNRITAIFPTGNQGTLAHYYMADSGFIYAKTGTLSGVVALSGYLITRKKKTLIFSVLVNNHKGNSAAIRRAIEQLLLYVRNRL